MVRYVGYTMINRVLIQNFIFNLYMKVVSSKNYEGANKREKF